MPQKKPKAMPDFVFKMMTWFMKIEDLFNKPAVLVSKIPLKRGMTVVDYACGPGRYTIPVAKIIGPEGRVYAVDIQHLAVEAVRNKARIEALSNIKPILVDSFDTGIPGSSADLVLLIDALSLIANHDPLFHEIRRLLKPGGFLFLDASHMRVSTAKRIVETTELFTIFKLDGKVMLFSLKRNGQK
jgi:ubiquinone/menaquinone biosynthesis C-methylase UbiE